MKTKPVEVFKSFEEMFDYVCDRFQVSGNNDLSSNDIVFETPDGSRIVKWQVFERKGKVVIVPSGKAKY
jgi:hypothetical protein